MRPNEILREHKYGHGMPCPYNSRKKTVIRGDAAFCHSGHEYVCCDGFVMKFYHLFSFAHFCYVFCLSNSAKSSLKNSMSMFYAVFVGLSSCFYVAVLFCCSVSSEYRFSFCKWHYGVCRVMGVPAVWHAC